MENNVVDLKDNSKFKGFKKEVEAKPPSNKEIVNTMFEDFTDWLQESYGFTANYQELRQLAVQLFWSEYVHVKRQELADAQAKEMEQKTAEQDDANESQDSENR